MKALLQKLVETPGPSGYEKHIRDVVRHEVEPFADQVRVDALGNLIVRRGSVSPGGLKIMVVAHIDEIGLVVSHVDRRGFARFERLGMVYPLYCLGGRVRFLNSACGVIGSQRPVASGKLPGLDELYIDLGAVSAETCPVHIGDVGVFDRPLAELNGRLVSKALDDRVGVAVLIETLRQLASQPDASPHQYDFVFSVQEEVGVRGATAATYGIDPDLGLAVDVCATGDTPNKPPMEVSLGAGPAIKVRDQGMLSDPRVIDWMVATARSQNLPYQMEILKHGSSDARAIQLARAGVPAGALSIPCRYVHSPSEMVDLQDVNNTVALLLALLRRPQLKDW
jgi:putative aminopeptidase FrvX